VTQRAELTISQLLSNIRRFLSCIPHYVTPKGHFACHKTCRLKYRSFQSGCCLAEVRWIPLAPSMYIQHCTFYSCVTTLPDDWILLNKRAVSKEKLVSFWVLVFDLHSLSSCAINTFANYNWYYVSLMSYSIYFVNYLMKIGRIRAYDRTINMTFRQNAASRWINGIFAKPCSKL